MAKNIKIFKSLGSGYLLYIKPKIANNKAPGDANAISATTPPFAFFIDIVPKATIIYEVVAPGIKSTKDMISSNYDSFYY